jgi:predicted DNA-binding transcriptional regulator AlpA
MKTAQRKRIVKPFGLKMRKEIRMTEQLLTPIDTAKKLAISRTTFYKLRYRLIANGLQYVVLGGIVKYRQSSLDRLIADAAEQKKPIA